MGRYVKGIYNVILSISDIIAIHCGKTICLGKGYMSVTHVTPVLYGRVGLRVRVKWLRVREGFKSRVKG